MQSKQSCYAALQQAVLVLTLSLLTVYVNAKPQSENLPVSQLTNSIAEVKGQGGVGPADDNQQRISAGGDAGALVRGRSIHIIHHG